MSNRTEEEWLAEYLMLFGPNQLWHWMLATGEAKFFDRMCADLGIPDNVLKYQQGGHVLRRVLQEHGKTETR